MSEWIFNSKGVIFGFFDWCQKYGDVVVFDTTYKSNAYQMPFRIFVGINNHGKTILFRCALLWPPSRSFSATVVWLRSASCTFNLLAKFILLQVVVLASSLASRGRELRDEEINKQAQAISIGTKMA